MAHHLCGLLHRLQVPGDVERADSLVNMGRKCGSLIRILTVVLVFVRHGIVVLVLHGVHLRGSPTIHLELIVLPCLCFSSS